MSPPIISDHVMSHDGLLQQILNPLSNSVSCDRRGTFGMFASAIFYLLVPGKEPHQAVSATSVSKTPVLSVAQL